MKALAPMSLPLSLILALGLASASFADVRVKVKFFNEKEFVVVAIKGFNAADEALISKALGFLVPRTQEMMTEEHANFQTKSRYVGCTAKYSTRDFHLADRTIPLAQIKENNAFWTYADFVMSLDHHMKNSLEITINMYDQRTNSAGRANVGHHPDGKKDPVQITINLNRQLLSKRSAAATAGTIWHEFLHTLGWKHGQNLEDYKGSVIKEAGLCVQRKFEDNAGFSLVETDDYAYFE